MLVLYLMAVTSDPTPTPTLRIAGSASRAASKGGILPRMQIRNRTTTFGPINGQEQPTPETN